MHHLDEQQQSKNFTFKCHREGNEIYSVNSLNFHPVSDIFLLILTNIKIRGDNFDQFICKWVNLNYVLSLKGQICQARESHVKRMPNTIY